MSRTVTISDDLAALLEERRKRGDFGSVDAAAEALIVQGLATEATDSHTDGRSVEELRALISEADTSGPAEAWDAKSARAEIMSRYAARRM